MTNDAPTHAGRQGRTHRGQRPAAPSIALSLCAALTGLGGCDDDEPTEQRLAPREAELMPAAFDSDECLVDTKIVLHHSDDTVDDSQDLAHGLSQLARAGDRVDVSFHVSPKCASKGEPTRVTLAAYMGPGNTLGLKSPPPQLYDVAVGAFDEQGGALSIQLPPCSFMAALAFGDPIVAPSQPDNHYEAQGRLIAQGHGGDTSCKDEPILRVRQFDTAGPAWGDAPLTTSLGWQVDAAKPDSLTCALDFDNDTHPDVELKPCPADTSDPIGSKLTNKFTYEDAGEHSPTLIVSDGVRRVWAQTTVFANKLDFRPDVRFPEQATNFVSATLKHGTATELATLTLQYATKLVPAIEPGDVVVGRGAGGYMLRVTEVIDKGAKQVILGQPVGLEDTVERGFFGVRDLQLDTADARCADDSCLGTVSPLPNAPGGPKGVAAKDGEEDGEETKIGVKIAADLAGGKGQVEVFAGFLIERFTLDVGWTGIRKVDIKAGPAAEVAVSIKKEFAAEPTKLGRYYLGSLPTPVPISIHLTPRVELEAALKVNLKGSMKAPFIVTKDGGGWQTGLDPEVAADPSGLDTGVGLEAEGEVKASLVAEHELSLGFLKGPYVAPVLSLGAKATVDACEACLTPFFEGGAEFGWHSPWWGGGELFEPSEVTFAEVELAKKCFDIPGICDPEPPGGGSWGDVHLVSYDGLLFDFQAGGEFVLTRATAGAPFEVQTRQEPVGDELALSYNTAVATAIDGHRVGIYTRLPSELYVDGSPTTLAPGDSLTLGGGLVTREHDALYVITHPTGERIAVSRVGAPLAQRTHLNVSLELPQSRAGQVEGLLGDADGDRADDISLGGGEFLPHPVSFQDLHDLGPAGFAAAWRVTPATSLFDYAAGTDAQTFLGEPYSLMPTHEPGPRGPHAALADELCASCPLILRDTCVLDVSYSGESEFAEACQTPPATPSEILPPSDGPIIVFPRDYEPIGSCDEQKLVFRAPGAANADQYPDGLDLKITVWGLEQPPFPGFPQNWLIYETFQTTDPPTGGDSDWGLQFTCEPLGDSGWGECTLRNEPRGQTCGGEMFTTMYRWSVLSLPYGPNARGHFTAY